MNFLRTASQHIALLFLQYVYSVEDREKTFFRKTPWLACLFFMRMRCVVFSKLTTKFIASFENCNFSNGAITFIFFFASCTYASVYFRQRVIALSF